jgi:antitoxin PrlF
MHYSSLTNKGQTTIPIAIREKLHLAPGDKIGFIEHEGYFMMVPLNKSLKELKGILPKPKKTLSCKEIDEAIRGPYDRT